MRMLSVKPSRSRTGCHWVDILLRSLGRMSTAMSYCGGHHGPPGALWSSIRWQGTWCESVMASGLVNREHHFPAALTTSTNIARLWSFRRCYLLVSERESFFEHRFQFEQGSTVPKTLEMAAAITEHDAYLCLMRYDFHRGI